MAGPDLIIDDVFVPEMATYFKEIGHRLELIYGNYIDTMKEIRSEAVMSGAVAGAIDVFIEYAEMISSTIEAISLELGNDTTNFMTEIDEKDQYLFDNF